jgi:ABC-type transport system involved in multi-copper enzyme maturation permease subunit
MASNLALTTVKDRRGLNGFGNYFSMGNHRWWGTRRWWIQLVIWFLIMNGIWLISANPSQNAGASIEAPSKVLEVYFAIGAMFPALGVVVLGQDALIPGRQNGTTAWVLSKPVSRPAFILSKLAADGIGILVTMVLVQGLAGYLICRYLLGVAIPVPGFLGAIGLLGLHQMFFLALAYMLGSIFRGRGVVLAIPMVFIFTYQLHPILGWIGKFLPWNLVLDGPGKTALTSLLVDGLPLASVTPIIGTVVLTLVFILVALWRVNREEF